MRARVVIAAILTLRASITDADTRAVDHAAWAPRPVRFPVNPTDRDWPAGGAETTAPVTITEQRAAVVWLAPAETARIRVARTDAPAIRIRRVTGGRDARLWIDEPSVAIDAGVLLAEPTGPGATWVLTAPRPITIQIEHAVDRVPRLAWELARADLVAWSTGDGDLPPILDDHDEAIRTSLLGARALVHALGPQPAPVAHAFGVWRRAEIEALVAARRPAADPYVERQAFVPAGPTTTDRDGVAFGASPPKPWQLAVAGPCVVVAEARAERPASGWSQDATTVVEVRANGAVLGRRRDPARPPAPPGFGASVDDDPAAGALGRRVRVLVTLGPGQHTLEVASEARWLRLERRVRRPRLRDALGDDLGAQVRGARAGLVGVPGPAARLADRLLARVLGAGTSGAIAGLAPVAELYAIALETAPLSPADAAALVGRAYRVLRAAPPALASAIILALAQRLPDGTDATALATIVIANGAAPAVLAAIARHLPGGPRSDAIAAAEAAWRRAPTGESARRALLEVTRYAPLRRLDPVEAGTGSAPRRWLVPVTGSDAEVETADDGALVELELDRDRMIDVPAASDDATRLGLVRVYVVAPPDTPGPIRVQIDDREHLTLALVPVEPIELAVAAGRHRLRVAAPPRTRVFVAGPGVRGPQRAQIRTFRATSPGEPRYKLPAAHALGPLRVELRAPIVPGAQRFEAWLHGDAGPPRRLVLEVRGVDHEAWPLDDGGDISPAAAAWLWLPPLTSAVWITSTHPELLVHLGVRRGPSRPGAPRVPLTGDPLTIVAEQSRAIVKTPADAVAYIARARALIELGELAAARRDLAQATSMVRDEHLDELAATIAALEDRGATGYLPPQPSDGRLRDRVALAPLMPDPVDLAAVVELARRVRHTRSLVTDTAGAPAPSSDLAVQWVRARAAELAGDRVTAAQAWRSLGTWQGDLAALGALVATTQDDPEIDAVAAYGLAAQLADIELPRVRAYRAAAARASRWSTISNSERNAGSIQIAAEARPPTPHAQVRRALLAVPWDGGKLIDTAPEAPDEPASFETAFSIDGPRRVRVEVWCRRPWPRAGASAGCEVSARLGARAPITGVIAHGTHGELGELVVRRGRHRIVVATRGHDPDELVAVRVVDANGPVPEARRTGRRFLATARRPAELLIAGPMTLGIEVHRRTRAAAVPARATVRLRHGRDVQTLAFALPWDPADRTATVPPHEVVVVVPAGIHRVGISPDRGQIAVRFSRRIAVTPVVGTPASRPTVTDVDGGLPWRPVLDVPLGIADEPHRATLVPSVEVTVGRDTLEEIDEEAPLDGLRFELAAQLRRRTARTGWRAELRGRRAGPLGPTAIVRATGEARDLPGRLRVQLDARAGVQRTDTERGWRLDGRLDLERAISLTGQTQVVPDVSLLAGAFGPELPAEADPWIVGAYRRDHRLQLALRTAVRSRPFADQQMVARVEARSNEDLASLDQVGATLAWRGLIELAPVRGPIGRLAYHPRYHLRDDDRPASYLRHEMSAQLAWPFALRRGRLGISAQLDVYSPSPRFGWASAVGVAIRWDDVPAGGRSRLGFEEPLADYVEQTRWADDR